MASSKFLPTALTVTVMNEAALWSAIWNQYDIALLDHPGRANYKAGIVTSDRALEEVFRLRYEVFNLELGEGLQDAFCTGLDRDEFDEQMTHLVLFDTSTSQVAGTYRLQTVRHGLSHKGLYCAREFEMGPLEPYMDLAVESGRACIAPEHRSFAAVLTLWMGIGVFMNLHRQRYVFGCCSLTTSDPDDGWRAMKTIVTKGYLHPTLRLQATPSCSCGSEDRLHDPSLGPAIPLPKLFRVYMSLGAKVISEPAIDREFGTVDFLVMLDGYEVALSGLDILTRE